MCSFPEPIMVHELSPGNSQMHEHMPTQMHGKCNFYMHPTSLRRGINNRYVPPPDSLRISSDATGDTCSSSNMSHSSEKDMPFTDLNYLLLSNTVKENITLTLNTHWLGRTRVCGQHFEVKGHNVKDKGQNVKIR